MRIVVIGGHLTPALAVLRELKGHDILYIGRKNALEADKALSLEYRTVTALNIKFKSLVTGRLQRKFTIHTIPSLFKLPIGFIQSFFTLKNFKPERVVGFGGYVQVPVILSAFILRAPIIIHEQTLGAGLANKICSIFAKKICISWESSVKYFPKNKIVVTGNPIRKEILNTQSSIQGADKPILYITGGSLGSHGINSLVEKSLTELLKNFRVIHQTGDAKEFGDFERLEEARKNIEDKSSYLIKKFLTGQETAQVLQNASLVVSRAGMNTITELIYLKKPCLLIPINIGKEQKQNADFVRKLGLAEVANQDDLTPTVFVGILESMLRNVDSYRVEGDILPADSHKKIAEVVLNAV